MTVKRKVINLVRVSTDAQDCQRQHTDLVRVNAAHALDPVRTVQLDGVSGRSVQDDPDFKSVIRDLERPEIAGVAISALDRLFRPDHYSDFSVLDHFRRAKKLIFSAKEGVLDPSSDIGFMMSLMSGAQAGMEWRELRRRTLQGKAEKRLQGLHVDGAGQTLPKGIEFVARKNERGRIVGGTWRYDPVEAARIRKAYDLLFERRSWPDIARTIGGGWRHQTIRRTLQNPLWKGVKRYGQGDDAVELTVLDPPLISAERWESCPTNRT